jgi:hypothetical protein
MANSSIRILHARVVDNINDYYLDKRDYNRWTNHKLPDTIVTR